ncbi:MAG TPA: protein-L-isoaspartate(D-aspartate) O-methyltransferase [candidate division Zixibacteria bacterium]|nr:protein-L-isoaspartate(D-aspartate) O-methyltransferase [candidate division Zixibacteria bacterium]
MIDYAEERQRMVERQLRNRDIRDERVLRAMATVPRELFVPDSFKAEAYADSPAPIGAGQTISQPYMVAKMTELLRIDKRSRVLEIGAGCGYQTAILAELAGEVFSVEVVYELMAGARERLRALDYQHVRIRLGDGWDGWPEEAPFDAIIVTAAAPTETPPALLAQLADSGRLIIPRGSATQRLYAITRRGETFEEDILFAVRFVPLVRAS